MDSSIARERIASVIKPDSITASQGDFLATHVPIKRLELPAKFEHSPRKTKGHSESAIYKKFVLNPDDKHQFVAVYGQSGTGKSHLIRWFEAKYQNDKPENEVVLFIRRSDNTLKGTIRQLLAAPEVEQIANRDIFERLSKAVVCEEESKLKGRIYYDFVNEVGNDEGDQDISITNVMRKKLVAFLLNEKVMEHLKEPDGPFERIYSKIAENTSVDRDTIAEFTPEDFLVSQDLYDQMVDSADQKASKLARALMADDALQEDAAKIASYLNQFVDDVIQRCAGIEPGDFRDIFQDIRKELFKLDKKLTLFIEDVTSFTGVDNALLDALIVEHSGMNESENLCRISSFVGTTSNYLERHFRDNHKDRITQYVYIPSDIFDEEGKYEFVGRYLNTMSLPQENIDSWVKNHAHAADYPVHTSKEGENWDYVTIEHGKKLCLYPFTRQSILNLYSLALKSGHETPRYIIRDIIEPAVNNILSDKASFPSFFDFTPPIDVKLDYRIGEQVKDKAESARLLRFLTVWGDGTPYQETRDGINYLCSIREDILQELGFPKVSLLPGSSTKPASGAKAQDGTQGTQANAGQNAAVNNPTAKGKRATDDAIAKVNKAIGKLGEWTDGQKIDVSATVGTSGVLRAAQEDICTFVRTSIDWQAEGVSQDNIDKIKASSTKFVTFENPTRQLAAGFVVLPAERRSAYLISAFIRWREFGECSWNYEGSDFDAFLATSWISATKKDFVAAVNDTLDRGISYIQPAIAAEIYYQIMKGQYTGKTLNGFTAKNLFAPNTSETKENGHSSAWKALVSFMEQKGRHETNQDTARQYFNITQGAGGSVVVLNEPALRRALEAARKYKLSLPTSSEEAKDRVTARNKAYEYYEDIDSRIDRAVEEERHLAESLMEKIDRRLFGETDEERYEIEEDDLLDFAALVKSLYDEANTSQLSIQYYNANVIKNNAKKYASAIEATRDALEEEDVRAALMAFSSDPIASIRPFAEALEKIESDLNKIDNELQRKMNALGDIDALVDTTSRYGSQIVLLRECFNLIADEVQ